MVRRTLTSQDWADAALAAISERGIAGVAVEPLAARLGATKGSFYWHFPNRDALVEAALKRWEEICTEEIIAFVEAEPDPELRLHRLLDRATASAAEDRLEIALLASAKHPVVAAVLHRVTERRIAYTSQLFEDLGFSPSEAQERGLFAYCAHLGHDQLTHAVPQALPTGRARTEYMRAVLNTLLRPVRETGQS
ncbi:TetR/AcrR family transcriptional regulator [Streptomyces sp. NPDC050504]|uniref:TetR/AcrR family transcriptional regulator n=1 Tax=Streptomyces sp. NPDC050504 TaxID=3365618 RepID=UPI0037A8AECD